jgi:hypothetical protein
VSCTIPTVFTQPKGPSMGLRLIRLTDRCNRLGLGLGRNYNIILVLIPVTVGSL